MNDDWDEVNYRRRKRVSRDWIVTNAVGKSLTFGAFSSKKSARDAAHRLRAKSSFVEGTRGKGVPYQGKLFVRNKKTGEVEEI